MRGHLATTAVLAAVLIVATGTAATTIDDFQLAQSVDSGAIAATEAIPGGGVLVLGDARDLAVTSDGAPVTATAAGGQLAFFVPPSTTGTVSAVWDGPDGAPQSLDPAGLGGIDLTDGGSHDAFALTVISASAATIVIEVHSDAASWSVYAVAIPDTPVPTPYVLPYSAFAEGAGGGARFDDVGAVVVRLEGLEANAVLGPIITAAASPQLVVTQRDLNSTALGGGTGTELGPTPRPPGGTYTMAMTITNTGEEATGVFIDELLDPDLFVVGGFRSTPVTRNDVFTSCAGAVVVADGSTARGLIEGTGNDYDPDGQPLTVVAVQATSIGGGAVTLDDSATGRFSYVPPSGLFGIDRFSYTVADTDGNEATGQALIILKSADQCAECDNDGDGWLDPSCGGSDCDDFNPDVNPGATEVCDGVDNNCDGAIDEGFPPDCVPCDYIDHPECTPGDVRPCGTDVGMCTAGTEVCGLTGSWRGVCTGQIDPEPEVPNGLDDNCDGTADEDQWPVTTPCPDAGATWRVMAGTAPGGDGLSWATAFATIDEALAAADPCDEVWVSGIHTLPATIVIDSPIRIYGGFAGTETTRADRDPETNVTTIDGGGTVHCLSISAGTLLDGLTVSNCYEETTREGGAIDLRGAILHLRDLMFIDNVVWSSYWGDDTWGGAVFATGGATLSIEDSHFESNDSRWHGGAIYAENSDVLIHRSSFVDNHTDLWNPGSSVFARGGAIHSYDTGTLTVIDSTFERNASWAEGNAIFATGPTVTILGSEFRANTHNNITVEIWESVGVIQGSIFERNGVPNRSDLVYGILDIYGGSQVTVSECEFVDNDNLALSATRPETTLEIVDSTFSGNHRSLRSYAGQTVVSNTRFEGDLDRSSTVLAAGVVSFSECTFADNLGSGLQLTWADAVIDRSVLTRNAGHFYGGALDVDDHSNLTVTSSLIVDNTCDEDGAAAFVDDYSTLTLDHVTIVGNTMADEFGAAVRAQYHSTVNVTNSVVWGNWPLAMTRDGDSDPIWPTYSVVPDEFGWNDPSLHNFVGDPGLVDPANNDYRLASWSAALDIAAPGPVLVDFDGRTRDYDGDGDMIGEPDPGAYEYVEEVPNMAPISVALDDAAVDANGVPLTDVTLSSDQTCDPDGDWLAYTWYGPRGLLSGGDPEALLPFGTSLLTLVTDDGAASSLPHTIRVHVEPCHDLTALSTDSDAQLDWTAPGPGDVFRSVATRPFDFGLIAMSATSGYVDAPPTEVDVALYAVVSDNCASDVVAVFVGDAPPANSPPVIWSRPADYSDAMHSLLEPVTLVTARFGIPYGYHVRAADPDGDALSFTLIDGPAGAGINPAGLFVWAPDQTGLHPVEIEVSDGNGGVATQLFSIQVDNRAPTADAGRSFTVEETGITVTLDGSASSDPDGDALTFAWELVSSPLESTATLSDPTAEQPELTPDLPGRYELVLVVGDGALSSLADTTFVETLNIPPVAVTTHPNVPGEHDSTHWRGEVVQLDGSGSWDPEDRPLSFEWTMTRRPVGSEAALSNPTDPRATFVADAFGEYDVMLVVSDGHRESGPAWSFLAARNRDPVGDAGPDRSAAVGETVTFDCSQSYDPDGDSVECWWWLTPPGGSSAWIIGHPPGSTDWYVAPEASFVPDAPGTYWVDLIVYDPEGADNWVTAQLTVDAGTNPPEITTTPPLAAVIGQPWTYDADATDPDVGDTATWSLGAAPSGMAVVPATGVVTWTPALAQIGDHAVELRATDTTDLVDAQLFTVSAALEPMPPRIGCPPELFVVAGEALGHQLEASDPNGDPLTFDKVSGPAAATITDDELEWLTTTGDAGVHTLVARVSDGALEDSCSIEITVTSDAEHDGDFDGWSEADGDCDDDDPTINPDALDVAGDGIDQNCDGSDSTRSVGADGPTGLIELLVGESARIPHVITVDRPSGDVGDLALTQEVVPAAGLQLEAEVTGTPDVTASLTQLAMLNVTAELPGDYDVTTTVTDTLTGAFETVTTPVLVISGETTAHMLAPGFFPNALPVNDAQLVDIAVRLIGAEAVSNYVWLDRTDAGGTPLEGVGWLADTGEGADVAPGDRVFSGTILAPASPEGALYYQAATVEGPPVISEIGVLPVTRFPIGPPNSDLDDVIYDPETGGSVLAGQISVTFVPGTTPTEIEAAVAALGATVSGYLPSLEVYVLSLPPLATGDDLAARLATIESHPAVDRAVSSGIVEVGAVTVTDPLQGDLAWPDAIRSTEAWVFGFSGNEVSTAVVDTGIDGYHPDLLRNHRPFWSMFCGTCSIADDHSHGTVVTGIFASDDNSVGFAGMLPDTNALVVKAFDEEGRSTTEHMAYGLVTASKRGVEVINGSFGLYRAQTDPLLMTLVDYEVAADGALLIAAAGNDNTNRPHFPAAGEHTLAVGGVGVNSERRWYYSPRIGSNYGTWVDIAAPAENVFTTMPTLSTTAWDPYEHCFDYTADGYPLLTLFSERRAKGCYGQTSGTSLATPMVVGAAGMVLDRFPNLDSRELRRRLEATAVPRTNALAWGLGHGLLNAQQAVFNGNFEAEEAFDRRLAESDLRVLPSPCVEWSEEESFGQQWPLDRPCYHSGGSRPDNHGWRLLRYGGIPYQPFQHVHSVPGGVRIRRLGSLVPPVGEYMAMLSTGGYDQTTSTIYGAGAAYYWTAQYADILEQTFPIAPGQDTLTITFDYDFVTEEAPFANDRLDWPGADQFTAVLEINGRREEIELRHMWEMEFTNALTTISGVTLSEGLPVRHTGWQLVHEVINLGPTDTGPVTIRFALSDGGGRDLDSVVLIDDVLIE